MLSKNKKVNTELFKEILNSGKKTYFKYFYIQYLKNNNQKNSHITVVVPKKQFKKAVERNNTKRKVFGVLKDVYPSIPSYYNIIIFLKKEIIELKPIELQKEIKDFISKLK